ncbi:MAG TPA: MFS transporter [Mobilitalea sp.]|nr:MFS transporter [Mobilitalea sp.]
MKSKSPKSLSFNLLMINAFVYIALSFYMPFLSSYYSKVGLDAFEIGILFAIGPLLSIFIQPLWAILSDRTGRRKDILTVVVLGSAISMFSYYIGRTFYTFFIATVLLSLFTTAIIPLSDAIIIRTANKNNLDFSRIRLGGTVGFAIMVIFAGIIVYRKPSIQFALGFLGYMILFIFVRRLPKEENEDKAVMLASNTTGVNQKSASFVHKDKRSLKDRFNLMNIFTTKQIIFVLAYAFISQIGLSFYGSFIGVYLTKSGLGENTIGIVNCMAALSEIPILFSINRIIRKLTSMRLIILSCILMSIRIFIITGGNIAFVFLAQALQGVTYMTIYYSSATFINTHVKPGKQSQGQSTIAVIQSGIASILGNIAGGYLVDIVGIREAYFYIAAMIIVASLLIVTIQVIFQRKEKLKIAKVDID